MKKITGIFTLIIITLTLVGCTNSTISEIIPKQNYSLEVYGIKYGDSMYTINKQEDPVPFAWMYYLIKYNNKIMLVDTGSNNKEKIEKYITNYHEPIKLLAELGINPSEVTDIIITHNHWDHTDNVNNFNNATVYVQKDEVENLNLHENQQLITFEDILQVHDFFIVNKVGKHTKGSSTVTFIHNNKTYTFSGDECYFLKECVLEGDEILTFHDPEIFTKYEKFSDNILGIITKD